MGDLFVLRAVQADERQHLPDFAGRPAAQGLDNAQVFLPGQVAVVGRRFNQRADILQQLHPAAVRNRLAEHRDFAARGARQAEYHFQGRRFARAVRAEEPIHRALRHPQVQGVDAHGVSILFAKVVSFYKC